MSIDPRTIQREVRRVMFARRLTCMFRVVRKNVMMQTGEAWEGRERCGTTAHYATVRRGRVSPRCEEHARADAEKMGIFVNENTAIEYRARRSTAATPPTGEAR